MPSYRACAGMVGIHVLAPDELEPERIGSGGLRLADVESGEELELVLDAALLRRYREHLEAWKEDLKAQFQRQQGLYFQVRSDDNLELLFLRDFQAGACFDEFSVFLPGGCCWPWLDCSSYCCT